MKSQLEKGGSMTQVIEPSLLFKPLQELWEHDEYTFQHSLRVADLLKRFGQFLNMPIGYQDDLYKLGALHDIGKTKIPNEILNKSKPLTTDEWQLLMQHPVIGYNMLTGEGYSSNILSGLLYHHENYDGTGYPFKMKGNQLPLFAQMLRIVDCFDAITNERSYQNASTVSEALNDMSRLQGSAYEPSLIGDFESMLHSIK